MTFLINVINMKYLMVINAAVEVFFFADDIVLCALTRSQLKKKLKKLLKFSCRWDRNNEM